LAAVSWGHRLVGCGPLSGEIDEHHVDRFSCLSRTLPVFGSIRPCRNRSVCTDRILSPY
jgi:hypothetical protein